jgi:hypothetical protein
VAIPDSPCSSKRKVSHACRTKAADWPGIDHQNLSVEERYKTEAAELYRKQLSARVKGEPEPRELTEEERQKYKEAVKSRVPLTRPVWTACM